MPKESCLSFWFSPEIVDLVYYNLPGVLQTPVDERVSSYSDDESVKEDTCCSKTSVRETSTAERVFWSLQEKS